VFESVTIGGTRNVVAAAVRTGAKLLYVSSDAVYALRALKNVVTEKSPVERTFAWFDYYRRAKALAEQIVRRAIEQDQIEASIVRPGLLLGERDQAMFTGMMSFLKSGMSVYIGSGHNRLPYVYVGDVAEACIQAATRPATVGEIYNVASDESVTQRDLLQAIANATGLNQPRRSVPVSVMNAIAFALEIASVVTGRRSRPAVTRYGVALMGLEYREDITKIRNELGWEPMVRLKEAIDRTVCWRESQCNSRR
jgi:nucleoside-diphosphate-sugar epimerase